MIASLIYINNNFMDWLSSPAFKPEAVIRQWLDEGHYKTTVELQEGEINFSVYQKKDSDPVVIETIGVLKRDFEEFLSKFPDVERRRFWMKVQIDTLSRDIDGVVTPSGTVLHKQLFITPTTKKPGIPGGGRQNIKGSYDGSVNV